MQPILSKLKSIYGLTASLGTLVPGYAFFSDYAPPLFKGITFVTSALCVAFMIFVLQSRKTKTTKTGIRLILVSFILLLFYLFVFAFTTVVFPNQNRLQVGFGTFAWSLTKGGVTETRLHEIIKAEDFFKYAGFDDDSVFLIWKQWTVFAAGYLLIFLFALSSIVWTVAWCFLANTKAVDPVKD